MRSIALSFGAAVLAGCASQNLIQKGMDELVGQPIDAAIAKLGVPTAILILAGSTALMGVRPIESG
jgi:hypothetical protein